MKADGLRVLDFGGVTPLRSQTLWHAVGYGVSAGAPPTLCFMWPTAPYVSIGYHRSPDEVDQMYCAQAGLPIYRRMVGGGPVYCDSQQQFFQVVVPIGSVGASRPRSLRELLQPAVRAFRDLGIPAELDERGEICLGRTKISGHGAGQVGESAVVVGNLITHFDHAVAARVLRLPSSTMRAEVCRLMNRYVSATPASPVEFRAAMVHRYTEFLGARAMAGELTGVERRRLDRLDRRFPTTRWLWGDRRPNEQGHAAGSTRLTVKIRAGVSVTASEDEASRVIVSVVDGVVDNVLVEGAGPAHAGFDALVGARVEGLRDRLHALGEAGGRVADAVTSGHRRAI